MKPCKSCKVEKPESAFRENTVQLKDGVRKYLRSKCRECESAGQRERRSENPELFATRTQKWREENPDKVKEYGQQYNEEHKEEKSEYNSRYFQEHKEELRDYQNKKQKSRRQSDPTFRLRQNVSNMIGKALKRLGSSKGGSSSWDSLPYTKEELWAHLEKQFSDPSNLAPDGKVWMTKDNWGVYDSETWRDDDPATWTWQIDHIVPQAHFQFTSMEDDEFQRCWALENLRPYSAKQNRLDGDRDTKIKPKNSNA